MDPTNLNQNANQMPANSGASVPPVMPVNSAVPTSPAPVNPATAASPAVPASPAMPTNPATPASQGVPQVPRPMGQQQVASPMGNPATSPMMGANPNVAMPAIDPSLIVPDAPGVAGVNAAADVRVGATDPITMPNLPKAPDPVEEELKAPMTAAAPVPGSIGSAISMPAEQPQTPNVAFNDPAKEQVGQANQAMKPAKKKMDKKTLIMLCAVAGIVVVALVIVLITMLN